MQQLLLIGFGILGAGLLSFLCQRMVDRERLSLTNGVVWIALALSCLIGWGSTAAQYQTDRYDRLTFQQFLNGVETGTAHVTTSCTRDGSCYYTYACDPYIVVIPHPGYTTGTGQQKVYHSGYTTTETRHHDCPYADTETAWYIDSTLGRFTVSTHRLPANPQAHQWDTSEAIPQWVVDDAGSGTPPDILDAQHHLDAGDPRPATTTAEYSNFILASDNTIVKVADEQIASYTKAHLFPPLVSSVVGVDQAQKASFVGVHPSNTAQWQDALNRLNMEAGLLHPVTRRFDIQLVAVSDALVPTSRAESYTTALNAYWESPFFGHSALPKNMVVVVVGTDGKAITWSRGFTLIRRANGTLWQDIQTLVPGTLFTPERLVGMPHVQLAKDASGTLQPTCIPSDGVLETLLILGPHAFVRQHMNDHPGVQGYTYLEGDIYPGFWTCLKIVLVSAILGLISTILFDLLVYKYKNS